MNLFEGKNRSVDPQKSHMLHWTKNRTMQQFHQSDLSFIFKYWTNTSHLSISLSGRKKITEAQIKTWLINMMCSQINYNHEIISIRCLPFSGQKLPVVGEHWQSVPVQSLQTVLLCRLAVCRLGSEIQTCG